MKRTEGDYYPHLEMLHELTDVPYLPGVGVRVNKEAILDKLGFSHGTNVARKETFKTKVDATEVVRLVEYARGQFNVGRFLSLLVMREAWGNAGGCPVIYLMDQDDLDKKVRSDEKKALAIAQGGEEVDLLNETFVQTYSRKRSQPAFIAGFDNYDIPERVRLGGGFRLQIDNVGLEGEELVITCSGMFSFNDMGSRVLALASEDDELVPRYSRDFRLLYRDGVLLFQGENLEVEHVIESGKADLVVGAVVNDLMEKDGKAITSLFRSILSVKPVTGVHQLEGIYSITDRSISAEIIDFDGVDALDLAETNGGSFRSPQEVGLSPEERLVRGKLAAMDFLISEPVSLHDFVDYRKAVQADVERLLGSQEVEESIKQSILSHFSSSRQIFSRELTGPVKLGRLLRLTEEIPVNDGQSEFRVWKNGKNKFIFMSVNDYELAYWDDGEGFVETSDIEKIRSGLSKALGKEITKAHINAVKEGD